MGQVHHGSATTTAAVMAFRSVSAPKNSFSTRHCASRLIAVFPTAFGLVGSLDTAFMTVTSEFFCNGLQTRVLSEGTENRVWRIGRIRKVASE